jgi:hypothetical protein
MLKEKKRKKKTRTHDYGAKYIHCALEEQQEERILKEKRTSISSLPIEL